MKMMKNKWTLLLILCITLMLLSGCKLAKEDPGAPESRLIGAFLTDTYLDLTDQDAVLEEIARQAAAGKEVQLDSERYMQPLQAVVSAADPYDISFPGVSGWPVYAAAFPDDHGEICNVIGGSDAIQLSDLAYNTSDDEVGMSFHATCTLTADPGSPTGKPRVIYINPMYQSDDGQIWVVSGEGISVDSDAEGAAMTVTFHQSSTKAEGGKEKTVSSDFRITVTTRYAPIATVITEMSADDQPLRSAAYQPGMVESSYTPAADCAYLLVDNQRQGTGELLHEREIVEKGSAELKSWTASDDQLLYLRSIEVLWPAE